MPALGEPRSGELNAVHVSPPSRVTKTREGETPPVTIQALFLPWVATQVPLEAKEASPRSAVGRLSPMSCQFVPSLVRRSGKRSITESLWAIPRCELQNAKQS